MTKPFLFIFSNQPNTSAKFEINCFCTNSNNLQVSQIVLNIVGEGGQPTPPKKYKIKKSLKRNAILPYYRKDTK